MPNSVDTPDAGSATSATIVVWRIVAAALALTQLAAPAVAKRLAGDFLSTGATNDAVITPAGYVFSIWSVICVLSAATMVAVLFVGLRASWELTVLVNASIVFVGFSAWLAAAARNWLWTSVAIFAVMVAALATIMRLLVLRAPELSCPAWLARLATVTFGLYLGWSSARSSSTSPPR